MTAMKLLYFGYSEVGLFLYSNYRFSTGSLIGDNVSLISVE